MSDPANPKDLIGSKKPPIELIPEAGNFETSLAFLEGALKYGRFNWRKSGVRASIYKAALLRHLAKWWNGSDRDPLTRVKHLANARACIDILFDAEWSNKLVDDRPIRQPDIEKRIDELTDIVKHLQELFKDHNPPQYTIADSEPVQGLKLESVKVVCGALSPAGAYACERLPYHEGDHRDIRRGAVW